jgi:hypothetical protein
MNFNIFSRVIWHFTSDKEHLGLDDLVGFSVPLAMFLFGQPNLYSVIFLWTLIIFTASFSFSVIGLNAGHHHPDNAHEGDELWYVIFLLLFRLFY